MSLSYQERSLGRGHPISAYISPRISLDWLAAFAIANEAFQHPWKQEVFNLSDRILECDSQ
jgi:hypothetical protein